jgi:nucleoid DNA-binding protein
MTKTELIELLKREDEWTVLELLDVTSEELVDAFLDKVSENIDRVYRYYDQ